MTALLSKAGSKLTVKQLLDTLQETMEFEASITRKFGTSVRRFATCSTDRYLQFRVATRVTEGDYTLKCDQAPEAYNVGF